MATAPARLDPAATRAAAQALYDERMTTVDASVTATNAVREAQAALAEAERGAARAWADAERSGWTADELRRLGLEPPARRTPGRPRRTRSRASNGDSAVAASDTPGADGQNATS